MHRWFLIVMIALLPLRGWAGEAMAGEMIARQVAAVQDVAVATMDFQPIPERVAGDIGHRAPGEAATPMADCHGAAVPPAASAHDGCGACSACQACQSAAFVMPSVRVTMGSAARLAPPVAPARFASAEPTRGFKPPIS